MYTNHTIHTFNPAPTVESAPIPAKASVNRNIPWVEKYRPTRFDDIVLDKTNKQLFENILEKKYFPNLLFYGPPGTGKTTTVINIINEYQRKYNKNSRDSIIHLNASDDRGIDIIRNQINQFVKSLGLFESGLKFVILDEADYMTKNAQQALKYLLQTSTYNVRFCLICNYISKIDESLQNEFICVRFNQLPKLDVYTFLRSITDNENILLSDRSIDTLQEIYHSDIRSMINFIQLNQNTHEWEGNIVTNEMWEQLHVLLCDKNNNNEHIIKYIHDMSIQFNMDKKNIIQTYFNYIIRNHKELLSSEYLTYIETIIHNYEIKMEYIIKYFVSFVKEYYLSKSLGTMA
jgi:replication factor C subunit 3/5